VLGARLAAPASASAQDMTVRPDPSAKLASRFLYSVHNAPGALRRPLFRRATVCHHRAAEPLCPTLLGSGAFPKDCPRRIIPDLAQRWEISPDRQEVHVSICARRQVSPTAPDFITAEDSSDLERHRAGRRPRAWSSAHAAALRETGATSSWSIPHTIDIPTDETRAQAYMLSAFASGWNIIVRKRRSRDQGNLRLVMNYPARARSSTPRARTRKSVSCMSASSPYLLDKGFRSLTSLEIYHSCLP